MKHNTTYHYLFGLIVLFCACTHSETQINQPISIPDKVVIQNTKCKKHIKCMFITDKPKPYWVDREYFEDNEFVYVVGSAETQNNIELQIKAAELAAKQILSEKHLTNIESQLNIHDTESKTKINDLIQTSTQSLFFNAKRIDVWKDGQNCLIYVLIRLRKR